MGRKKAAKAANEGATFSAERRALLLAYCRITEEELDEAENALLEECYWAAVGYMLGAGVAYPAESDRPRLAQYNMVVNALVLEAWDQRDITVTGTIVSENPALRRLLVQLKLTELPCSSGA